MGLTWIAMVSLEFPCSMMPRPNHPASSSESASSQSLADSPMFINVPWCSMNFWPYFSYFFVFQCIFICCNLFDLFVFGLRMAIAQLPREIPHGDRSKSGRFPGHFPVEALPMRYRCRLKRPARDSIAWIPTQGLPVDPGLQQIIGFVGKILTRNIQKPWFLPLNAVFVFLTTWMPRNAMCRWQLFAGAMASAPLPPSLKIMPLGWFMTLGLPILWKDWIITEREIEIHIHMLHKNRGFGMNDV